jgi:hypothetical protein
VPGVARVSSGLDWVNNAMLVGGIVGIAGRVWVVGRSRFVGRGGKGRGRAEQSRER